MFDSEYDFKFVIIGDSTVGKTCLMLRFVNNFFPENQNTTLGIDFRSRNIEIENQEVKCQIWDTAGQERFRNLTTSYYRRADVVLIVYSIDNTTSYDNIEMWLNQAKINTASEIEIVLVGTKNDLENREVSYQAGSELAKELGVLFYEVSSKNGKGIENMFVGIIEKLIQKKKNNDEIINQTQTIKKPFDVTISHVQTEEIVKNDNKNNKSCC
ncbi:ras and ef-hand domain-containing protein [Anaeramoeba flamelloides]|uniref:Ras and ef-hand domain-containing protein n=1 Tax=Anaeramoeba flamelloides TaxID=1746091 RepID=A0ABQ8XJ54_9EUKA|nr:ras and ef-hand domain-containing protein [Anaeramoeba flamelloides]